jgi:hypothetical protein
VLEGLKRVGNILTMVDSDHEDLTDSFYVQNLSTVDDVPIFERAETLFIVIRSDST